MIATLLHGRRRRVRAVEEDAASARTHPAPRLEGHSGDGDGALRPCPVHFHRRPNPCANEARASCSASRAIATAVAIWNLLHAAISMRTDDDPAARPSIDTGWASSAFRRSSGKRSNWERSVRPLIARIAELAGSVTAVARRRRSMPSSRTSAARRRSSSRTASFPRTNGAATCFAASCGAPCATGECSASPSHFSGRP